MGLLRRKQLISSDAVKKNEERSTRFYNVFWDIETKMNKRHSGALCCSFCKQSNANGL